MATTYNNLYMDVRRKLQREGVEGATLEARELVCFAAGKDRQMLSRDGRLYVPPEVEERTWSLVRRRLSGEPVAYLIGEWEFFGLPLDISEHVLIPRVDTEVLAGEAISWLTGQDGCRVLDLCAGSGCVGLAVAKHVKQARVILGEISEGALRICRQNIRRNGLSAQVLAYQVDVREKPPARIGQFDCIVSNPPYIPRGDIAGLDASVRDYEPHLALDGGDDGLDFYRVICEKWTSVLRVGGRLYFEVGIGQADAVLRIMRAVGFGDIQVVEDSGGIPRVVFGTLCQEI